jgi:surface antigen
MLDTRALLFAAAAGLTAPGALAMTPLSADLAVDPDVTAGASEHAVMAPREFERLPDEAYEPTARISNGAAGLQCVPFAREASGVEIFGNANTWWEQARGRYHRVRRPEEGAVLVLHGYDDANRGHVAHVRERVSERLIVVDHANWLNAGEVTRDVPIRDVSAAGDWSQVQVWNVAGGHWGGRVYRVQGFILNAPVEPLQPAGANRRLG